MRWCSVKSAETPGTVLLPGAKAPDVDDPTGWKAIDRLVGSVKSGLNDVSERHDDYLHGDPHD